MPSFVCARCADPAAIRMRNSALCQGCWKAITDAGLRWCPRCQEAKAMFLDRGYCPPCRRQVDRERNGDDAYRAAKNARNRAWMARQKERAMTTERCEQCGRALTPDQIRNVNRCCSPACARAWKASQPKPCPHCGEPVPKGKKYCKQACRRAHEARTSVALESETAPIPILTRVDPQEPSCAVTAAPGDVLGREGGYTYTVNGAWVSRAGMGRTIAEWERLRNWGPCLPAYRRCHAPQPVVLPMGAEPVTAWGRRRQGEEVTE